MTARVGPRRRVRRPAKRRAAALTSAAVAVRSSAMLAGDGAIEQVLEALALRSGEFVRAAALRCQAIPTPSRLLGRCVRQGLVYRERVGRGARRHWEYLLAPGGILRLARAYAAELADGVRALPITRTPLAPLDGISDRTWTLGEWVVNAVQQRKTGAGVSTRQRKPQARGA